MEAALGNVWVDEAFGTKIQKTRGDRRRWRRWFLVDGLDNLESQDAELHAYMRIRSYIVEHYPVFGKQRIQELEVEEDINGGGLWRGECTFISPTTKQLLDESRLPEYSFSTKGGTSRITHSRKTVNAYPGFRPEYEYIEENDKKSFRVKHDENGKIVWVKETAPNFRCGIGWNGETGSFEGIEIKTPAWQSTLKVTVPNEYVDSQYLRMLRLLSCSVNSMPFDGFAPGECLFVGVDGSRRVQEKKQEKATNFEGVDETEYELVWDLTFEFLGLSNAKKWVSGIGWVYKRGWDYMHTLRRPVDYPLNEKLPDEPDDHDPPLTSDSTATTTAPPPQEEQEPMTVSHPVAAYVEQVYPYADFRVLGLDLS